MSSVALRPLLAGLVSGAFVLGCADIARSPQADKLPTPSPAAKGESACFYAREVQNFQVLDNSTLLVFAPNRAHAYRVRISPPSMELRFAERLAFQPASGRICGYAGERLILGPGRSPTRLAIIDVTRAPASDVALPGSGTGQDPAPVPQPQSGPGAEVEGEPAPGAKRTTDGDAEK